MIKFLGILNAFVIGISTLSASLIKQDGSDSKVETVTIADVSNKFESHNYWKESYSYIQLHISWHDAKYFLRALKEQDMEEINYFINEWNVLLNDAKDPEVWGDKQQVGINAITNYFKDFVKWDINNSKEWFRNSAATNGLFIRLEGRTYAEWKSGGSWYQESEAYYVDGIEIDGPFDSNKIYNVLVTD